MPTVRMQLSIPEVVGEWDGPIPTIGVLASVVVAAADRAGVPRGEMVWVRFDLDDDGTLTAFEWSRERFDPEGLASR